MRMGDAVCVQLQAAVQVQEEEEEEVGEDRRGTMDVQCSHP